MKEIATKILTAVWNGNQDPSEEEPNLIYWSDGGAAVLDDYRRHLVDTHVVLDERPDRFVIHMFPAVEADVTFSAEEGSWMLQSAGHAPVSLELPDPRAKDDEIQAEVYTFPIVFRVRIRR